MKKQITMILILQSILILALIGCTSPGEPTDNTSLDIADFYGEYIFDEVAYMRKSSAISEEQYRKDLKALRESFTAVEFSIGESYFYETSRTFGESPAEGFKFMTVKDYGEKHYDNLARENVKDFKGLSSIFDYGEIKRALNVNEIQHYIMYMEDSILSNPTFYISSDNIFVAMETISFGDTDDDLKGYTHYLLKLKKV